MCLNGKFEPVRCAFVLAWLSLSVAQADPCAELGRAIDVLVPAVRNSGQQIDQAFNAQRVASAINAYADAAETLATTIQRLRPSWRNCLRTSRKLAKRQTDGSKLFNRKSTPLSRNWTINGGNILPIPT